MATAPNTEITSACPTTIATLRAAYVRAFEAHNTNEEESFSADLPCGSKLVRSRAMAELMRHTDALSSAILREMPTDAADATLVAWHTSLAVSDTSTSGIHAALQNLTAFLGASLERPLAGGEWFAEQYKWLTEDVSARNAV